MWTYDLTNDLMVELEAIELDNATMLYIVENYLYELHPMNEQVVNDFINDK